MECSFCTQAAILNVGNRYCVNHLGIYESRFFEQAVMNKFTSKHQMMAFFQWAFGTDYPKCSDLQKWHDRIPRLERNKKDWIFHGIYNEEQDWYIGKIVGEYLRGVKSST